MKVKVTMISLGWLFKNRGSFLGFCEFFNKDIKNKLLQSKFIAIMMQEFWQDYQKKVLRSWFYPQLLYIAFSVHYFAAVLHIDFTE